MHMGVGADGWVWVHRARRPQAVAVACRVWLGAWQWRAARCVAVACSNTTHSITKALAARSLPLHCRASPYVLRTPQFRSHFRLANMTSCRHDVGSGSPSTQRQWVWGGTAHTALPAVEPPVERWHGSYEVASMGTVWAWLQHGPAAAWVLHRLTSDLYMPWLTESPTKVMDAMRRVRRSHVSATRVAR